MDMDASWQQQQPGKEQHNRKTYLSWMRGKCFGCGSPDHTKKDGKHEKNICSHCKKLGHCSSMCFSKYSGKLITAKAAATEQAAASSSTTDSKGKASISATTLSWTLYFIVFNLLLFSSCDCGILHMTSHDVNRQS